MADWQKIKTEYITTETSYRKLAEKHGISYQAICRRSKAERWGEQREQHMNKTVTKTINRISEKQVDRAAKLISVADQLLDKVQNIIEIGSEHLVAPQNLRHLSGVLKDIKDIQMIRSDADMREQEARIKKLQKEAEQEDTQTDVAITFGSEEKRKWAE